MGDTLILLWLCIAVLAGVVVYIVRKVNDLSHTFNHNMTQIEMALTYILKQLPDDEEEPED